MDVANALSPLSPFVFFLAILRIQTRLGNCHLIVGYATWIRVRGVGEDADSF